MRRNRVDGDCGLGVLLCKRWEPQATADFLWALLFCYSGSGGEPPGQEHQGDSDEGKQIVENQ